MAVKNSKIEYAMLKPAVPAQQHWESRNVENLVVEETEKPRGRKMRLYKG